MKIEHRLLYIKNQYFSILAGAVCILLITGAYIFYTYEENSIRRQKEAEIKSIADLKIGQIHQWLKDRTGDTKVISESPFFIENVSHYLDNINNIRLRNDIIKRLTLVKNSYDYNAIYLSTVRGEPLISTNAGTNSFDPLTVLKVKDCVKNSSIEFRDFYFCRVYNEIRYDIIVPVIYNNTPVASLIFHINPYDYLYPLIQSWPVPSESSETLLVKKDGDSVLYLNELRLQKNTALKLRIPLSEIKVPAVQAVLGVKGIFEGKDYRGENVLAYIKTVPGTPWFMIAKVDKSEIYSELYFRAIIISLFTIALIILTGTAFSLKYNSGQKKTLEKLLNKEIELRKTQEEHKTVLYSIGDAVITTDISGLINRMNPVAEQLTGWNEAEGKGLPLEKIFRIIHEVTRETIENPVVRVLKEGLIIRLANHTLLISKDGRDIPIADSGAPVRNEAGEISGVVLVFRDQSEERASRKALQESETLYHSLFENMLNGFAYCKMLFENNRPVDFIYLAVNPSFEKHTGLKNVTGKKVSKVIPGIYESDPKLFDLYGRVALGGKPESFEIYVEALKMWFSISVYSPAREYFVAVFDVITERKQAEISLRKTKLQLQLFIEHAPAAIAMFDNEMKYITASNRFLEDYNLGSMDITGKSHYDIFPEIPDRIKEIHRHCLAGAIERSEEDPFPRSDGRTDWVRWEVRPWYEYPEKIGGIILFSEVITARKQAEEALHRSEEKFSILFNKSSLPVLLSQYPDHKFVDVNDAWLRLFGFTKEEVIGKNSIELEINREIEARERIVKELHTHNTVQNIERTLYTKSGDALTILTSINTVTIGGQQFALHAMQDITARKQAEESLKASTRFLQIAYTNMELSPLLDEFVKEIKNYTTCNAVGIRILDQEGNIPYLTYLGFSRDFYEKESPLSIKSDNCMCINVIKGTTDAKLPFYTAGGSFYMNGTTRFLATVSEEDKGKTRNVCNQVGYESVALIPIRFKYHILGLIHVADTSENKVPLYIVEILEKAGMQLGTAILRIQAEEEIRALNEKLEEKVSLRTAQLEATNKELEAFSYSVSHDLRAPLRHISGYMELLASRFPDSLPEKGKHYLDSIADSIKQMGQLIDDLLQFSRTSRQEMHLVEFEMNGLLQEVLDAVKKDSGNREITWTIPVLPSVCGDYNLLKLVWYNLLSNAVKFTRKKKKGKIEIGYSAEEKECVFSVRDNGAGFDMQYADKLFGVFQRLHSVEDYEGTGIGLANVRRIILRHKGRTWAEGETDKGAVFYFSLPKNKED
ncbi:MAG: PAS domain S-box protein [Spirochaetota bacterium]